MPAHDSLQCACVALNVSGNLMLPDSLSYHPAYGQQLQGFCFPGGRGKAGPQQVPANVAGDSHQGIGGQLWS